MTKGIDIAGKVNKFENFLKKAQLGESSKKLSPVDDQLWFYKDGLRSTDRPPPRSDCADSVRLPDKQSSRVVIPKMGCPPLTRRMVRSKSVNSPAIKSSRFDSTVRNSNSSRSTSGNGNVGVSRSNSVTVPATTHHVQPATIVRVSSTEIPPPRPPMVVMMSLKRLPGPQKVLESKDDATADEKQESKTLPRQFKTSASEAGSKVSPPMRPPRRKSSSSPGGGSRSRSPPTPPPRSNSPAMRKEREALAKMATKSESTEIALDYSDVVGEKGTNDTRAETKVEEETLKEYFVDSPDDSDDAMDIRDSSPESGGQIEEVQVDHSVVGVLQAQQPVRKYFVNDDSEETQQEAFDLDGPGTLPGREEKEDHAQQEEVRIRDSI